MSPKHPRVNGPREAEQKKNCEITVEEKQRQEQSATRMQSHSSSRDSNITWSILDILDPEAFNGQEIKARTKYAKKSKSIAMTAGR